MPKQKIDKQAFIQRITFKTEELGLSVTQVAAKLKLKRQSVDNWFQGRSLPRPEMMLALAKCLGVTVSWLKWGESKTSKGLKTTNSAPQGLGTAQEGTNAEDLTSFYGRLLDRGSDRTAGAPDLFAHAVSTLKNIYESGDHGLIAALQANIAVFGRTLRTDNELSRVTRANAELTRRMEEQAWETADLKERVEQLEAKCRELTEQLAQAGEAKPGERASRAGKAT